MESRMTINEVIQESGVDYTYEELCGMISSAAVNSTEIFYVDVVSEDPKEAEVIANTIGKILPDKIASVVEGSSVRIVDYAVTPVEKDSPHTMRNTVIGMVLGMILASLFVIIAELQDNMVHDSDYLSRTYDIPVLAVIPDLQCDNNGNGYYTAGQKKQNQQGKGK
jgi:capsular polysaccharide biosynthesis protein